MLCLCLEPYVDERTVKILPGSMRLFEDEDELALLKHELKHPDPSLLPPPRQLVASGVERICLEEANLHKVTSHIKELGEQLYRNVRANLAETPRLITAVSTVTCIVLHNNNNM